MRTMLVAPVLGLGVALAAPFADASAKIANIEFSGEGFDASTGFFAGAPALAWNGSVTLDLGATDGDPSDQLGVYTSTISNLEFRLPQLGVNFSSTAPEQITQVTVTGNTRTLSLDTVNVDEDVELASNFTLTDLGSVFTAVDDTLPQTEIDFSAFDELAFSLAFADTSTATPTPLGDLLVTPNFATLEIVETPLPASFALFGTAVAAVGLWRSRCKRTD